MKKVLPILVVLAMALPSLADVAVTADGTTVTITPSAGAAIRGVALNFETTDGTAALASVDDVDVTGLNTNIDYFYSNGIGIVAGDTPAGEGHAVADPAAAGVLATLPASEFSVSSGYLDAAGTQLGQTAAITIAVTFTGSGEVTVTEDMLRGGIVGDNLGTISGLPLVLTVGGGEMKAIKDTAPFFADWQKFGEPACWAYAKNCRGDVDGLKQGSSKLGYWHVGTNDLAIFLQAWEVKEPATGTTPSGPGVMTITNGICADFARDQQGSSKLGYWRVGTNDLGLLLASWEVKEPATGTTPSGPGLPDCTPEHYNFYLVP